MPTINYNAALPAFSSISGRSSIDINKWVSELKFNISSLIKSLFANGEQGFVYDPNDLSTMFQDSAGTVPVTDVGQPVGLILDKRKGVVIGAELIADPSFNDPAYWNVTTGVSVAGGNANFNATNPGFGIFKAGSIVTGRIYKVIVNIASITSGGLKVMTGRGAGSLVSENITTAGIYTFLLTSLGSVPEFRINAVAFATTAVISEVSVRELAGNHAYQTTSSMRPLLVASPQRLDYDTVDDKLITILPAQLTGCTVIRSVPNVGTQILTGQTIPTTYNDNTDHCGLIVVNRALTPSETSAITNEFNKRAGV